MVDATKFAKNVYIFINIAQSNGNKKGESIDSPFLQLTIWLISPDRPLVQFSGSAERSRLQEHSHDPPYALV